MTHSTPFLCTVIGVVALSIAPAICTAQSSAHPVGNNYADGANWFCRPDRKSGEADACNVDLTATVVSADGATRLETWHGNPKAGIDCFYVYPTVSLDSTPNSDMVPGPEELNVVKQQFARFGSQCRLFAPMYRQITLTALRALIAGKAVPIDRALAYRDVLDAWNYYLQHDNHGRGVVLIGHSQGSSVLTRLIADEIDGKPVQDKLVSALLLGWTIAVPNGKDAGGTFKHIPLCHAVNQTGCVIAYSSFRDTAPPPPNTRFGKVADATMHAACVNPAAIGGGPGFLDAYLQSTIRGADRNVWAQGQPPIATPFVKVPGLLSAECTHNDNATYLAVTVHGEPKDARVDDITGDVVDKGAVQTDWGLHLIDVNLTIGNLIGIVAEQSKMFQHPCPCKR